MNEIIEEEILNLVCPIHIESISKKQLESQLDYEFEFFSIKIDHKNNALCSLCCWQAYRDGKKDQIELTITSCSGDDVDSIDVKSLVNKGQEVMKDLYKKYLTYE